MEDLLLNMSKGIAIHWFRQDLRIKDNPSLEAASQYESIIPVYILDDVNSGEFAMGAASRWWLHKSCLLYTSPSPRDATLSRMPSSA